MACHDKTLTLSERALAALDAAAVPPAVAPDSPQVKRESLSGKDLKAKDEFACAPRSAPRRSRAARTSDALASVLAGFKFDWFQAVMPGQKNDGRCIVGGRDEHSSMRDAVRFFEARGFRIGEPTSGGRGYGNGLPFYHGADIEAAGFIASGSNTGGMPNLTIKGGKGLCATLAPELQEAFPGMRATRIDVALDVIARDESEFRALIKMSRDFVKSRDMCPVELDGVQTPEHGRTIYVGGRESPVMLRVYEKGKHENAKAVKAGREPSADPLWLRMEFQFQKIPTHKKVAFSAMAPAELVCAHVWPRFWIAAAAKVIGLTEAMERAARHKAQYEPVVRTLEDTARAGADQYGKAFCRMAAMQIIEREFGGDAAGAVIDRDKLTRHAAAEFLRFLRLSDKPDRVISNDRLDVSETPERRADAIATRQQEARIEGIRRKAQRRDELARQLAASSRDVEAVERARAQADRIAALHVEAMGERISEWAG